MPASVTPAAHPEPLTHRQILVVFNGLLLALFLAALDQTIVSTALPTIVSDLGGLEQLAWVVTSYLLASTVVTPIYGKLGDLYGRKGVLQWAVVIFLAGSALCGLSRNMGQLVAFRALQGVGAGGLMVTILAVIGDIVPPRDRGRYQGIFGAVFGVSSIAGPLLGGYLTTNWSWRWIFYVNLPVGLLALAVIAATLPSRGERRSHRIDYVGAALLAIALIAILLVTDLGGTDYAWMSPQILGLTITAILSLAAFVVVERRAAEPVLPMRLFANRAFSVTSAVGFVVGFGMFGSVTYLPLFLQVVQGASPTKSGLQMVPMMAGMLTSSITSGQLISRTGRYKVFPIVGTGIMVVALLMLARVHADTKLGTVLGLMLLLGLGMGCIMQVLVIAVQNAVEYRDLGAATAGNALFRSVGGSIGTAALGALFVARLMSELPPSASGGNNSLNLQSIAALPAQTRVTYSHAFADAMDSVFLAAAVVAVIGFGLTWFLPEKPLRGAAAAKSADIGSEVGESMAMPHTAEEVGEEEQGKPLSPPRVGPG
jgi:EmrB/QacA subfamily drug resistance transporter